MWSSPLTNLYPVLSSILPQHLRIAVSKLDMDISFTSLLESITGFVDVIEIKINWSKIGKTAKDFILVVNVGWFEFE